MYFCRVYFNRSQDFPYVWSMDRGTIETERNYKDVKISGLRLCTRYNADADNKKEPRAWFEVEPNRIVEMNGILYLD